MKYLRLFIEHNLIKVSKDEDFNKLPADRIDIDKPRDEKHPAGKYEVLKTNVDEAWRVFSDMIRNGAVKVELTEDKFKQHYINIQNILNTSVKSGKNFLRGQMPRISSLNAWWIQHFLKNGMLDIKPPYEGDITGDTILKFNPLDTKPNITNPFPAGLSISDINTIIAKFRKNTNDKEDIVNSEIRKIHLNELKPSQSQLFFDTAVSKIVEDGGEEKQIEKLENKDKTILLASKDLYIVDGHHRWCSGMLLKPEHIIVHVAVIDLEFDVLRGLAIKYMALAKNVPNE